MRDGLSLLDQLMSGGRTVNDADVVRILGTPPDERTEAIARAIAGGDAAAALGELDGLLESGVTLSSATSALADAFRNMMIVAACGPDSELIELPDTHRRSIGELAGQFSLPALVHAVAICQTTAQSIRGSSVARALVEATLVRLTEADKFVDPASLIERLEALAGGGAGGKRNPSPTAGETARRPPARAGQQRTAPAEETPVTIRWEEDWLKANWGSVVGRLFEMRQSQAAGCLRAVQVTGFDGEVLKLAFDRTHDGLRQRCANSLGQSIEAALSDLAGRKIRCEYVSGGEGVSPTAAAPPRSLTLSTEEKRQVQNDPAVKEVLSLFGGEIIDIRKQAPPVTEAAAESPPAADDGDET